jgi:hypothetical protein
MQQDSSIGKIFSIVQVLIPTVSKKIASPIRLIRITSVINHDYLIKCSFDEGAVLDNNHCLLRYRNNLVNIHMKKIHIWKKIRDFVCNFADTATIIKLDYMLLFLFDWFRLFLRPRNSHPHLLRGPFLKVFNRESLSF